MIRSRRESGRQIAEEWTKLSPQKMLGHLYLTLSFSAQPMLTILTRALHFRYAHAQPDIHARPEASALNGPSRNRHLSKPTRLTNHTRMHTQSSKPTIGTTKNRHQLLATTHTRSHDSALAEHRRRSINNHKNTGTWSREWTRLRTVRPTGRRRGNRLNSN